MRNFWRSTLAVSSAFLAFTPQGVSQGSLAGGKLTQNIGESEIKLGKERTAFFKSILWSKDDIDARVPFSGYRSMMMSEHTLMFWPVGRSDEVVFYMMQESVAHMTAWKIVGAKPKRLWQFKVVLGKGGASSGTLGKWLSRQGKRLAGGKSATAILNATRPYAAYIEVGAIGVFMCWVLMENGTSDPKKSKYGPGNTTQGGEQAMSHGFFVTPKEQMLLAMKGRSL